MQTVALENGHKSKYKGFKPHKEKLYALAYIPKFLLTEVPFFIGLVFIWFF